MKRIPNIQFTSPKADRKVMLNVSIVIMTLFGMFFAGLLAMAAIDESYFGAGIYLFLILIIIYQISRYFRELSKLKASK